jgi:hypothetical protein
MSERCWGCEAFAKVEAELMCREQEIKTLCELLERAQGWTDHWPDDLTEELRVTLEALGTRA